METTNLKKALGTVGFSIIACWMFGLATTFILIGGFLLFIDWIFGLQLANSFEDIIFSGSEIYRHFKVTLTGIPFFLHYAKSKNWEL